MTIVGAHHYPDPPPSSTILAVVRDREFCSHDGIPGQCPMCRRDEQDLAAEFTSAPTAPRPAATTAADEADEADDEDPRRVPWWDR